MKLKVVIEYDDGFLEYLEDIIGIFKYKILIEEFVMEIEVFNEVCLEKSNCVQYVEKEKNGFEEKKNKVLVYIYDENELVGK